MKAICIKNYDESNSRTTIGKVYEILQYNKDTNIITAYDYKPYFVADTASGSLLCSNGDELWYEPDYFITIEQWRDNQLKLIGIE